MMHRIAVTFLSISLASCCGVEQPSFVAVPEAIFREPENGVIALDDEAGWPAARARLVAFLAAGGNRDNLDDGTIVVPDAELRYGPLLDTIAAPDNRDVEDLTDAVYAPWLVGPPLRHVVDARDEAPSPLSRRHVLADGRYWWIFAEKRDRLVGLMVVLRHDWQREE
jgi:hypothetical protein